MTRRSPRSGWPLPEWYGRPAPWWYAQARTGVPAVGRFGTPEPGAERDDTIAFELLFHDPSWGELIEMVAQRLSRLGYSSDSRKLYRQVLSQFSYHVEGSPGRTNAAEIREYIEDLGMAGASWSWISANISVLRTVFDKFAGMRGIVKLSTPRRPHRLPEILSSSEVRGLLAAAPTLRDQLLLGLLYGCGLKVGEACGLRWEDVDVRKRTVRVAYDGGTRTRRLEIPDPLLPVLRVGKRRCNGNDFVFAGRWEGSGLSVRAAELIVRRAARGAELHKPVKAMTLRHSFAVHCLENGYSVRAVQEALGHGMLETTMVYQECMSAAGDVEGPLTRLRKGAPTAADVYDEPLSLEGIDLPFQSEGGLAAGFHGLLRTRIKGGFLSLLAMARPRYARPRQRARARSPG